MAKIEFDELEGFLREAKSAEVPVIGIKMVEEKKDEQLSTEAGLMVGTRFTVLLRLTATSKNKDGMDKDHFLCHETLAYDAVTTEKDYEELQKRIAKGREGVIDQVRKMCPAAHLVFGQVLP